MGSRGKSSNKSSGKYEKFDQDKVRRANAASSVYNAGDSLVNSYERNRNEINDMNLSDAEKKSAIKELYTLTDQALTAEGRAVSSAVAGPARYNVEAGRRNADKAATARGKIDAHMQALRDKQKTATKEADDRALKEAIQNAIKNKALSFTHNGITWTRKSTRSKTFTGR